MNRTVLLASALLALASPCAQAADAAAIPDEPVDLVAYLAGEAAKIRGEGDRIKGEADLMRSEAVRLNQESTALRSGASDLDAQWRRAHRSNPAMYRDYPGRDRSQRRMRHDALREDKDAISLREEGHRLNREAVRLWRLAAAIDPQAQKDLLDRIRRCCKSSGRELLRAEIVRLAHELGIKNIPE